MKTIKHITITVIMVGILSLPVMAGNMDHGKGGKGDGGHAMDHSGLMGEMIRETSVEGFELMYHLIDMKKRMKGMKGMEGMAMTHHLMLYIKDSRNNAVENATVGYLVVNPDGSKQKAMAMGMGDGYGADISLKPLKTYTIKTKVAVDGKKILDSFTYGASGG